MGIILDFVNVEQLVFNNKKVIASLPQYKDLFDSWLLSKRVPSFRNLEQKSIIDFLQKVSEEELEIIGIINNVELDGANRNFVRNMDIKCKPEELELMLKSVFNYDGLCCYRNKDEVKVFLWK